MTKDNVSSSTAFHGVVMHAMQVEATGARAEDHYYLLDSEADILETHNKLLSTNNEYRATYEALKAQSHRLGNAVEKMVMSLDLIPEPGKETPFLAKCAMVQALLFVGNLRTVLQARRASRKLFEIYRVAQDDKS